MCRRDLQVSERFLENLLRSSEPTTIVPGVCFNGLHDYYAVFVYACKGLSLVFLRIIVHYW